MIRVARYLGFELASPRVSCQSAARKQLDLAAAPRRLLIGHAATGNCARRGRAARGHHATILAAVSRSRRAAMRVVMLAIAFWRGATNLQGHARAGAQALADSLARQTRVAGRWHNAFARRRQQILAGLGSPMPVEISAGNPHVGKSLAEMKLRGLTGATVSPSSAAISPWSSPLATTALKPATSSPLPGRTTP